MIKDNCKMLTMSQVERLIERDGLGKNCEYSVEALKARRDELAMKHAAKIERTEFDNVDPSLYRSGDALLIEKALETMTVLELATILKCSRQAVSLWRSDKRPLPMLQKTVIELVLVNNSMRKYFLK
jgi:hypothetical protein